MIRKIRSFFKLASGGHWGSIFSKIPPAKFLITLTNFFAKKLSYRYILLGGHGMGMQSFRYYLEQIGATPREIYWYEMLAPFVFYRKDEGLLIDKDPKNKFAKKILSRQKISIPCYQIIRDPISIIKSCLNATIFHRISALQDKKDVENVLIEILKNTPHLMFYFTSLQNSIKHLATDITYLTQDFINQKNLQNTLNDFANRFNYSPIKIEESVLKGTAFPRAFPYIFEVEGKSFGLFLSGREDKHSELDMGTFISKKFPIIKEKIFFIKEVIFEGYEDYPLYLASLTEKPSNNQDYNHAGGGVPLCVEEKMQQIIEEIMFVLKWHKGYMMDENEILEILTKPQNYEFSKKLALKIFQELECLKDQKEILKSFIFTQKFLEKFQLTMKGI